MGHAAYNRASKVISARIDQELADRNQLPPVPKCLCRAARVGVWTAGVHHQAHRCARVITKVN